MRNHPKISDDIDLIGKLWIPVGLFRGQNSSRLSANFPVSGFPFPRLFDADS